MTKKTNSYRWTLLVLKGLLFAGAIAFVYYKVFLAKDTNVVRLEWQKLSVTPFETMLLLVSIILMPVNWGLDALKWKLLLNKTEVISFQKSLKATFAGTAVSFLLPNRVGGFLGRMLYLKEENRATGAFATVYGNLFQLFVTLFFGAIATLIILRTNWFAAPVQESWLFVLLTVSLVALLVAIYLILRPAWMVWLAKKLPYLKKWAQEGEAMQVFGNSVKIKVLILSMLRYTVFAIQFALVLVFYKVSISPLQMLVAIAVCWLVVAIVPSFVLGNLGIRETSVLIVFAFASASDAALLSASLTIWMINLVIPAAIGGLLLLKMKSSTP